MKRILTDELDIVLCLLGLLTGGHHTGCDSIVLPGVGLLVTSDASANTQVALYVNLGAWCLGVTRGGIVAAELATALVQARRVNHATVLTTIGAGGLLAGHHLLSAGPSR